MTTLEHIDKRVAIIETQINHLATKEDVANVKFDLLKWLVPIILGKPPLSSPPRRSGADSRPKSVTSARRTPPLTRHRALNHVVAPLSDAPEISSRPSRRIQLQHPQHIHEIRRYSICQRRIGSRVERYARIQQVNHQVGSYRRPSPISDIDFEFRHCGRTFANRFQIRTLDNSY